LTATFESVNKYGQGYVRFSREMSTEFFNISWINSTVADLYIIPSNNWHLYIDDFEVYPKLNATWVIDSYKGDLLILNITFLNPEQISPMTEQDTLVFHIKEREWFISKDFVMLETPTLIIKCKK
jgi:hypothetical protein